MNGQETESGESYQSLAGVGLQAAIREVERLDPDRKRPIGHLISIDGVCYEWDGESYKALGVLRAMIGALGRMI